MGCGASTQTAPINQNGTHPNGDVHNSKTSIPVIKTSMKGDYSQFQLSKYHREKQQKERQLKLFIAADELSGKVLEERERLSLGTRSRATSRNTSRTTSPTNNKRSAPLNEATNPMTPVIEDRNRSESYRSDGSLNQSSKGAKKQTGTLSSKKKGKHKHKKKTSKGEKTTKSKSKKNKKGQKSKSKKHISFEIDDHDSGLEDSAQNNHHSEESDVEHSADDELEQVVDNTHENNDTNVDIEESKEPDQSSDLKSDQDHSAEEELKPFIDKTDERNPMNGDIEERNLTSDHEHESITDSTRGASSGNNEGNTRDGQTDTFETGEFEKENVDDDNDEHNKTSLDNKAIMNPDLQLDNSGELNSNTRNDLKTEASRDITDTVNKTIAKHDSTELIDTPVGQGNQESARDERENSAHEIIISAASKSDIVLDYGPSSSRIDTDNHVDDGGKSVVPPTSHDDTHEV